MKVRSLKRALFVILNWIVYYIVSDTTVMTIKPMLVASETAGDTLIFVLGELVLLGEFGLVDPLGELLGLDPLGELGLDPLGELGLDPLGEVMIVPSGAVVSA